MQHSLKYAFDRVGAAILLALLSPLILLIGLAIKLGDRGPVFFVQQRVGQNGTLFDIWKFRTMIVNADMHLDEQGRVGEKDRITHAGRFLRNTSLDELPQLINILLGDMSFIGPRPVLPSFLPRFTPLQKRRLLVKPGITGLSQINGRNTLKWSKRTEYDVWYVDHYSLWLDLLILAKTVRVVLLREGIVLDRNPQDVDDLPYPPMTDEPGDGAAA